MLLPQKADIHPWPGSKAAELKEAVCFAYTSHLEGRQFSACDSQAEGYELRELGGLVKETVQGASFRGIKAHTSWCKHSGSIL